MDTTQGAPAAEAAGIPKAEHDAAVAAAQAEATKTALAAANARAKAIIGSEHAKGREALAQHFAFATDMTADAAIAALAQAPKAAEPRGSRLDGIVPTPKVDAGESRPADGGAGWARATERVNRARGLAAQ